MKSNPCNIFSATLFAVAIYVLGSGVVTAQLSIEGEFSQTKSVASVAKCDCDECQKQVAATAIKTSSSQNASATLVSTTSKSTCACCPGGKCEEACSDGSCVACRSIAVNQSQGDETPLPYSYSVRSTDAIPPYADCPSMDTHSIVVAKEMTPMIDALSIEQYCADMAELLAKSLANPKVDSETRQFAIESALKMAVRNSELKMESRFEEMKVRHQKELVYYRDYATEAAAKTNSTREVKQWMSPIYQNLERNYQQMRLMQASNVNMDRTLRLLEQMAKQTLGDPNPPRQRITLRSPQPQQQTQQSAVRANNYASVQNTSSVSEVALLKNQLAQMQAQLNSLRGTSYPDSSRAGVRQASANQPLQFQQRTPLPVLRQPNYERPMEHQRSSDSLTPLRSQQRSNVPYSY